MGRCHRGNRASCRGTARCGAASFTSQRCASTRATFFASSGAPQTEALEAYADRWQIETLFGCLKRRGFNFEDPHLTHPERLGKLLGLLALAFAWAYRTGERLHAQQPILLKKHSSDL